jgi:hypothetical protein
VTFAFPAGTVLLGENHDLVSVTWFARPVSGELDQFQEVANLYTYPDFVASRISYLKSRMAGVYYGEVTKHDLHLLAIYFKPLADPGRRAELLADIRNIRQSACRAAADENTEPPPLVAYLDALIPLLAPKRPAVRIVTVDDDNHPGRRQ